LPPIEKKYNIGKDAAGGAIGGIISGAICAFTVPSGKVLSDVGSFTKIRGGHVYPQIIDVVEGLRGVFRSDDGARSWVQVNDGPAPVGTAAAHYRRSETYVGGFM